MKGTAIYVSRKGEDKYLGNDTFLNAAEIVIDLKGKDKYDLIGYTVHDKYICPVFSKKLE